VFSSRELFRVAQTHILRGLRECATERSVASVQVSQTAQVIVRDVAQRVFTGRVTRTAGRSTCLPDASDGGGRAESDHVLLPGMYAEVNVST